MDIEEISEDREEEIQQLSQQINFSEQSSLFSKAAFRKMLGMSAPLMLSQLTNMLGGFGNVYLFSRLSADSLASAGLITATQNLFVASFGSSLYGASVLMTEALNRRDSDPRSIGILWRQTQLITFTYDLVVIPLFLTMDSILSKLGQSQVLLSHIRNYFNYYGIGYVFNLLCLGNQQVFLSHQNTLPILELRKKKRWRNYFINYQAPKNNFCPKLYKTLIEKYGFIKASYISKKITKEFSDRESLIKFTRPWLPYLDPIPDFARDSFLNAFINCYLSTSGKNIMGFDVGTISASRRSFDLEKNSEDTYLQK